MFLWIHRMKARAAERRYNAGFDWAAGMILKSSDLDAAIFAIDTVVYDPWDHGAHPEFERGTRDAELAMRRILNENRQD